jgi:hypothetical protein
MNDNERIEQIKKRLTENQYFIHPKTDVNVKEDIEFLVALLQKRDERISLLERKAQVLGQQVAELTTEIENVKTDFGDQR